MNRYIDGSYSASNPTWHEEDSLWKASQIAEIMERNDIKPNTLCEIGCGAGMVLVELGNRLSPDARLFGYEISPHAFQICSRKGTGRISFRCGDLLREEVGPFDVLVAADVIEHVEDCFGFLRKLRSKGSAFVFHIPLDLSVQTVLRGRPLRTAREQLGHLHYFTRETALELLCDTGYKIIDSRLTASALNSGAHSIKRRLASLPRRLLASVDSQVAARVLGGFSLLVLAR